MVGRSLAILETEMRFLPVTLLAGLVMFSGAVHGSETDSLAPNRMTVSQAVTRTAVPSEWKSFGASTIEVDRGLLDRISRESRRTGLDVRLQGFPLGEDLDVDLMLHEVRSITDDSQFVVMRPAPGGGVEEVKVAAPDLVVLAGHVSGSPDDYALLAQGDMGTMGYVRRGDRTYMISSGGVGQGKPTLIFDMSQVPEDSLALLPLECTLLEPEGALPGGSHQETGGSLAGTLPCRKVGLALETDNEFLNSLFGGNENAANAYASLLVTATTSIYEPQFNVNLEIEYIRLWSFDDPWTASNTSAQLNEFVSYWQSNMGSVSRDLAHFLSGRSLGGGVAYLDGLCGGSYAYAVSANLNGSFPYPVVDNSGQNWDIMVFSHELGHNFGSGHTHDSYSPPIDGCGNGDCSNSDGTIMSYCHLCPGGLANMRMVFHPRVETVILNHIESVPCNYVGGGEGAQAADDEFSVTFSGGILDILANDQNLSCGTLSLSLFPETTEQGGTLELVPATSAYLDRLRYTPPSGYSGFDSFAYTVSDTLGNTDVGVVNLLVNAQVSFSFAGGQPESIATGQVVRANVSATGFVLNEDTVSLEILTPNESYQLSMQKLSGNVYQATVPEVTCPGNGTLQLSARIEQGALFTGNLVSVDIGYGLVDFESPNSEVTWQVSGNVTSGDAGLWQIGTPDGANDRGDPATDYDGSGRCFLTGAATGNTDVDDGCTILRSQRVVADEDTFVRWAQWYDNSFGNAPGLDVMTVEISGDLGATWQPLDQAGPNDSESVGGWIVKEFRVSDYVTTPSFQVYIRWTVCDDGDGSVIEAAIDSFGYGSCDPEEEPNPYDLNGDGEIDGQDLAILLSNWGCQGANCTGDVNGDLTVNGQDLAGVLANWGIDL
ncbi:MAG: hypothetical protein CMJ33_00225 [Phycisphaerae bacterium]|nr:hypothetical protein [Phycisphaerae bacterium]